MYNNERKQALDDFVTDVTNNGLTRKLYGNEAIYKLTPFVSKMEKSTEEYKCTARFDIDNNEKNKDTHNKAHDLIKNYRDPMRLIEAARKIYKLFENY